LGDSHPTRVVLEADVRAVTSEGEEVPGADLVGRRADGGRPTSEDGGRRGSGVILEGGDGGAGRRGGRGTGGGAASGGGGGGGGGGADVEAIAVAAAERGLPVLLEGRGEDFQAAVETVLTCSTLAERSGARQILALRFADPSQMIRGYRLLAARLAERG